MRRAFAALLALGLCLVPGCFPSGVEIDHFLKFLKSLLATYLLAASFVSPVVLDKLHLNFTRQNLPLPTLATEGESVKGVAADQALFFTSDEADAFGFVLLRRELRHPFHFEATTGLLDAAAGPLLDGGFSAIEADVTLSDPLQFISASAQPIFVGGSFDTMNVFVNTENGLQGQLAVEAPIVDLALESNGANVDALVRPHGELTWQLVASVPRPAPDATWHPAVGVANLGAGGKLGFKDFAITANGPSPAKPGSLDAAIEDAWDGWSGLSRGRDALEGASPDISAASELLTAATASLTDALETSKTLSGEEGATKFLKKAAQKLKPALKAGQAVLKKVEKAKPKGLVKKLDKAQVAVLRALAALRAEGLVAR